MECLEMIIKYKLLVRPSFIGNWRAGLWQGVTGDGKAYCYYKEERETLEDAVHAVVQRIVSDRKALVRL